MKSNKSIWIVCVVVLVGLLAQGCVVPRDQYVLSQGATSRWLVVKPGPTGLMVSTWVQDQGGQEGVVRDLGQWSFEGSDEATNIFRVALVYHYGGPGIPGNNFWQAMNLLNSNPLYQNGCLVIEYNYSGTTLVPPFNVYASPQSAEARCG